MVHANVALETGEICLDLLNSGDKGGGAWTPAYSILECVRAVRLLLSEPEPDSPLNVDVAALLRAGDALGARRLVEFWAQEFRYGEGERSERRRERGREEEEEATPTRARPTPQAHSCPRCSRRTHGRSGRGSRERGGAG